MCGNLNHQTNKMFKDMLIFDQVRGGDSTGVFAIKNLKSEQVLEKAVGNPCNLWDWAVSSIFDTVGDPKGYYSLLMGHNRAATFGKVNEANCHPFEYEHLVGAHNGSLTNYSELDGSEELIDSQRLFLTINNKGVRHTWASFNGAAALVWFDKGHKTMNFIRNKERSLYYVYNKNKTAVFWASELWMITIAASRRNVELERTVEGGVISHTFAEHEHYTFNFSGSNVELLSRVKLEEREPEPFRQSSEYSHGYQGYSTYGSQWDRWEDHFRNTRKSVSETETKVGTTTGTAVTTVTTLGPPVRHVQDKWAEGTVKAEKETKDLEFVICGRGHSTYDYYVGTFLEDDEKVDKPYLEIIPRDKEEHAALSEFLYGDVIFRTTARCRTAPDKDGKITKLRISAQHIVNTGMVWDEMAGKKFIVVDDDEYEEEEESNVITLYRGFGNRRVTKEQLLDDLSRCEGGSCCYACGCDLDITHADQFMWLDKTMCVCQHCSSDRLIAAGMS